MGTSSNEDSNGVATDSLGNVYISGWTDGSLAGTNNAGVDAWVAKYNSNGTVLWKEQLGLAGPDIFSFDVATDSNGNVYITGWTRGSLAGTNQGSWDAWVAKYNSSGALIWKQQLGTPDEDQSRSVATDGSGNVYISGYTYGSLGGANQRFPDAWVAKYNSSGTLLWKRQLGSSNSDFSTGVATDSSGNVYISGWTDGSLAGNSNAGRDAWVAKYNSSGTLLWKQQLGTSGDDESHGVASDSDGSVYISGYTDGLLGGSHQGLWDAWIAKYNSSGTLLWKRQFGSSNYDFSNGLVTDSLGNVYISGWTDGSLAGTNNVGRDAWVAKYNSTGTQVWKEQLGLFDANVWSNDVATDINSSVYITGYTTGDLAGANQGLHDAWVVKYTQ